MFPFMEEHLYIYGISYMFGSIMLLFMPVVFLIMPETKDLSLDKIRKFFTSEASVFSMWSLGKEHP